MEPQLSISWLLLLFVRTRERQIAFLDSTVNEFKRKSPIRAADNCPCIAPILEAQQQLATDREELMLEVENALKKAALVWSAARPPVKGTKKLQSIAVGGDSPEHHNFVKSTKKSEPIQPLNPLPNKGSKSSRTAARPSYKPVYQTAPYKTEPEKPRKPKSTKRTESVLGPVKVDIQKQQAPVLNSFSHKDNSRQVQPVGNDATGQNCETFRTSTVAPEEPIFRNVNCQSVQENCDFNPICKCFDKKLDEVKAIYESNARSLNAALNSYDFSINSALSAKFERDIYTQLVDQQYYGTLSKCLVQKYDAVTRSFMHFIQLLTFVDITTLDDDQRTWVRSMFTRFHHLRDLLDSTYTRIQNESNFGGGGGGGEEDCVEESVVDPLGSWLDSMKLKQTSQNRISCQLMDVYSSMGSFRSAPLSRMFAFTGLPELCTFNGSSNQLYAFISLWDSLESMQFELQLLELLRENVPKLLDQLISRPDRVSAFRQLYGLVCSFHPVALKDNLNM